MLFMVLMVKNVVMKYMVLMVKVRGHCVYMLRLMFKDMDYGL